MRFTSTSIQPLLLLLSFLPLQCSESISLNVLLFCNAPRTLTSLFVCRFFLAVMLCCVFVFCAVVCGSRTLQSLQQVYLPGMMIMMMMMMMMIVAEDEDDSLHMPKPLPIALLCLLLTLMAVFHRISALIHPLLPRFLHSFFVHPFCFVSAVYAHRYLTERKMPDKAIGQRSRGRRKRETQRGSRNCIPLSVRCPSFISRSIPPSHLFLSSFLFFSIIALCHATLFICFSSHSFLFFLFFFFSLTFSLFLSFLFQICSMKQRVVSACSAKVDLRSSLQWRQLSPFSKSNKLHY